MRKYKYLFVSVLVASVSLFASCDDGHVEETTDDGVSDGYIVELIGGNGTLKSFSKFPVADGNTISIACFSENSDYAVMQCTLPKGIMANKGDTIVLSNVPTTTKTIEVAVVNVLRKRIHTLYSYDLSADADVSDTIHINMGTLFDVVNNQLFQRANCSRCHTSGGGAAGLDLSSEGAYNSLVEITAHKNPAMLRVKPFSVSDSYLYKVLSEDDKNVSFSHPSLMADYQDQLQVLKLWINEGAAR